MLDAVSDDDVRAVTAKLVEKAKSGDLGAIRELLDRVVGKPFHYGAVWVPEEELEGSTFLPSDVEADLRAMDATIPRVALSSDEWVTPDAPC
jgi:hypothetical protein